MTINYSKVSAFLIVFLIWNIVNGFYEWGTLDLYTTLWIIWLFASLFISILYLLDLRKNKKADDLSSRIQTDTQSRTADFLTSSMLGLGSLVLVHSILFITTKGFTISKTPTHGQWFPATAGLEIFLFLFIWIPSYFYILRYSNKKMLKISLVLALSYLFLFLSYLTKGS